MKLTKRDLKIIGAALYSCEGTKLRRDKRKKNEIYYWVIEFTNSNPKLIKLFAAFLRKIIKIEENKLKGQLIIYSDIQKKKLEKFWSATSGIPLFNFNKTVVLSAKGSLYKPNPNGTFKVRYHSKEAFKRLDRILNSIFI
ncbi:MAG: hypothetical protein NTV71_04140 [Candidatus Omnitrophica bacterium]|nr:hypothetical protein [Candidatus Omnitrophota bacterium]